MANLRKYIKLRKQGHTILGLYKEAKKDGMMAHEIVGMLEKVLPYGDFDSGRDGNHDSIIKFMRRMEFGEEDCMWCRKWFIGEPGEFCSNNCPDCDKRIQDMWDKVDAAQKESGEELDEDSMTSIGILIGLTAGDSLVVQEEDGETKKVASETDRKNEKEQEITCSERA